MIYAMKLSSQFLLIALAGVILQSSALAQLDDSCLVAILNRTAQVRPNGTWDLPNVPAGFGPVRARATCVKNGITLSGQSEPFTIQPNRMNAIPNIILGPVTPIPTDITVTAPKTQLTTPNETVQLTVTARFPDNSTRNITAQSTGTTYLISNPAIATITPGGLVTAKTSGTVLVQAQNEGTTGLLSISAVLSSDTDGDGIPDDVELANGLDPNNPADALQDLDRDGLNNREEIAAGTLLRDPDTDKDGLTDGEEVKRYRTNPLLPDTDGDGYPDRVEILSNSDPLNPASFNPQAALSGIRVAPSNFIINVNSVEGTGFQQLTVTGDFKLGGTINLTARSRGTSYSSSNTTVCNFGAEDGRVFGANDGGCTITISNNGFSTTASGTVRNFTPRALSQISIPGYANSVDAAGPFAYVAAGATGLQVVSVSDPNAPQIVGNLDTPGNANDIRIVGNLAYIADGVSGLRIINVTNPASPVASGGVDTPGDSIDVMVLGNRAYIADGSSGLAIINVTNPANPTVLKQVPLTGFARGVDVLEASNGKIYAILVTDSPSPALRVVDVSNPAAAAVVGNLTLQGSPKDLRVNGNLAYVTAYTGGLQIVDLTNPLAPIARGSLLTQFVPRGVEISGTFALLAEQLFPNAVPIVDISNPSSPLLRTTIDFSPLGDYAGTGIALNGPFVYMTGVSFVVSVDKGTTGDTRLFVGQFLPQTDTLGVPPQVSMTSPPNNSSVVRGSTITLRANASDDVAVVSVTFRVNGADVFTDTSAPYEASFTVPANATVLTVAARAIDLGGNVSTSTSVNLTGIADPLTTISGRVVRTNNTAVAGAAVTCGTRNGTSNANGLFSFTQVPTIAGDISCSATFLEGGKTLRGVTATVPPVLGGITNVGDLILKSRGKIGLLHCDSTGAVRSALIGAGIAVEDLTDLPACTAPPLTSLADFGAVLVWSNSNFSQPDAVGNVLADFVDQGGGVVLATYVFSQSWRVGGRMTTAGYSPFAVSPQGTQPSGQLNLANSNTAHPIMQGVPGTSYFVNSNYTNPPLTAGATLIASDTNGNRVVAVSANNRVVGISIFPGFGHMGVLFANALNFVR